MGTPAKLHKQLGVSHPPTHAGEGGSLKRKYNENDIQTVARSFINKHALKEDDFDPDPIGSESFSRTRKRIRIREKITPDPGSSGSELNL
jgi:hypothetical protein